MMAKAKATTEVAGVSISSPDRVVYPELGLTKLDVARHYARVAPLMLPHVKGRPISLVRCPEGSGAECFFQKHWVGPLPEALDTVMVLQSDGEEHPHVVANSVAALVTLAQWGVMEVHVWGSRADDIERPDRIVFDLDPGPGVTWEAMRDGARVLRALLTELGLESWVKSSGGKGLHVVVPITRRLSWDEVKAFAHAVADLLAREAPDRFLSKASKAARPGKIYVDWLRNSRGATWVAPWSLRARAEAGVSVPFAWSALGRMRSVAPVTLAKAFRLPASDPWADLRVSKQSLNRQVLAALRAHGG